MVAHPFAPLLFSLVLALPSGPAAAQTSQVTPRAHGFMHVSPEWMKAHQRRRAGMPVVPPAALPDPHAPRDTMGVDLTNQLNFTSCGGAPGWDQGQCGNCWVFGSTAAVSIDNGVVSGTPQLFSTQWFDSDFYSTGNGSACDGGDSSMFATWYNSYPHFIPWTNTDAGYADGNNPSSPATAASAIGQSPDVLFTGITASQIATATVSQAQAIANIKAVLNSHQGVVLLFWLPGAGWTDFENAWDSNSETTPWAGVDSYSGTTMDNSGGGHLVCVVGYDDTDNAWLLQNSWGTTNGRPDGLFELSQTMNYGDTMNYDGTVDQYEFDTYALTGWSNGNTGTLAITAQPASQTVAPGATATFSVTATGAAPLAYQWYQGTTAISGATAASYTTPAVTAANSGATYSVTVSNASGTVTSSSATLTVSASAGGNLIVNGGFEEGATGWTATSGVIGQFGAQAPPYAGTWDAWLCGQGAASGSVAQTVTIPSGITQATLAFYLEIKGSGRGPSGGASCQVQVCNPGGTVLGTLATYTGAQAGNTYQAYSLDMSAYAGQTVAVTFTGASSGGHGRNRRQTSFLLDNVSLVTQ